MPGVVAGAEADLNEPLPVTHDIELRQHHVRRHLDTRVPRVPAMNKEIYKEGETGFKLIGAKYFACIIQ